MNEILTISYKNQLVSTSTLRFIMFPHECTIEAIIQDLGESC